MTLKAKHQRHAAIFAAIEALQIEIQDREHALTALEVVYFGEGIPVEAPKAAKVKKTEEKGPRGSTTTGRKKARKGRAWTQAQKDKAAATRAATKAKAAHALIESNPAAVALSAHEALRAKSEAEVMAATNGPNGNPKTAAGSLTPLKLAPAIRAILGRAARPLTSTEIMDRLKVGGYQHTAAGPLVNSVTGVLSGMGLQYERRAGRNFYEPIRKEGE
jgi:hypothetical protein